MAILSGDMHPDKILSLVYLAINNLYKGMKWLLFIIISLFSSLALAMDRLEQLTAYNKFYYLYIDGEYLKAMKSLEPFLIIEPDSLYISQRDLYHSSGILFGRFGQYEKALYYLSLSEEFCDPPTVSPYQLVMNYNSRANIYQFQNDFQKSALFFDKALDMMLAFNDHS